MKAILYSRVSTDIQDYERQIEDMKSYASKHNLEIVNHFEEKESGKVKKRLALTEMLNFTKDNSIDVVIVSELSRLGRTSEVLRTIEQLNELKVNLISLKENLSTLNADKTPNTTAQLVIGIMASVNSHELSTLNYRIKSGLLNAAKQGSIPLSQLPYGYTKDGKKMIVFEEQAEVVRRIFELYSQGNGVKKIVTYLNQKGIKSQSGKRWAEKPISDILKNTVYIGKKRFRDIFVDSPVIVDEEIFNKVQHMFETNAMRQGIHKKYENLFENKKIVCGICGKSYFSHRRVEKTESVYKCISTRYSDSCGNWGVNIDKLNKVVVDALIKSAPSILIGGIDVKPAEHKIEQLLEDLILYRTELKKLENNESKLIDLYLDGDLNKENYRMKKEQIEKQKAFLVEKLNYTNERILELKDYLKDIVELEKNIEKLKEKISKELLNKVISKIVVTKLPEVDPTLYSKVKNDKVIRIDIHAGQHIISVIITRFTENVQYSLQDKLNN